MIFLSVLASLALATGQYGQYGQYTGYAGAYNPDIVPSSFSNMQGVAEKRTAIAQVFPDGLDSKPLAMFIAAGMLPRYVPTSTDGVDSSDRWLLGLTGETEEQVIAKAKAMYPMSAQLGHPENEELMPQWQQVMTAGLTTAPDHTGHNDNTKAVPTHPAFHGESEYEHPEYEGGMMPMNTGDGGTGVSETGTGTVGFNPYATVAYGEEGAGEHSEDLCPRFTADQCTYPCVAVGAFCTGELLSLRRQHAELKKLHAESSNNGGSSLTILYCLWGVTTGLVVGVGYSLMSRKSASKEALALDHYERA